MGDSVNMPDHFAEAKELLHNLAMLETAASRRHERLRTILMSLVARNAYTLEELAERLDVAPETLIGVMRPGPVEEPRVKLPSSGGSGRPKTERPTDLIELPELDHAP